MYIFTFSLFSNLRTPEEMVKYLQRIPTHYNFCLVPPQRNLSTLEDCVNLAPKEWEDFCTSFTVTVSPHNIKVTIAKLEEGKSSSCLRSVIWTRLYSPPTP